jgi:hypothetical protein
VRADPINQTVDRYLFGGFRMISKSTARSAICFMATCCLLSGAASDQQAVDSHSTGRPSDGGPAAADSQPDTSRSDREWLAEVRQVIGNRGSEPADKVFQHIELLKGKPASRVPGMMAALTGLLGVHCSHCHVPGRWESDEKSAKQMTREQFEMQKTINDRYFRGEQKISCWTCHRGHAVPEGLPSATRK